MLKQNEGGLIGLPFSFSLLSFPLLIFSVARLTERFSIRPPNWLTFGDHLKTNDALVGHLFSISSQGF